MPVAWHPKIWWNFCVSEDEKKEIDWYLLRVCKSALEVYTMAVLKHFGTKNWVWIFLSDFFYQNISKCIINLV